MRISFRWCRFAIAGAAAVGVALAMAQGVSAQSVARHAFRLPDIKHVWVIDLENFGYTQSFGDPAADPYLARTLPGEGALLTNFFGIGHESADNYIAQVSGQSPNVLTQADCPLWVPTPEVTVSPYDQVLAPEGGCVFPKSVQTVGNQLSAANLTWKAYLQDACGHPSEWGIDHTLNATKTDQYTTRHEGFMFFKAVTSSTAYCAAHVVSFQPLLSDLSAASTTPASSWITPNMCDDGHDAPCVTGQHGGLPQIDAFLAKWVPVIMASPAYKDGGLILITFDEGNTDAACCGESSGISSSHPSTLLPGLTGPGGGDVGLVALSPFIKPGTVSTVDYNQYSLLRTIEDIFGLSHLGDAAMPQVKSFGADVFTAP
jgi:phosphatidylinositol-3-phosphatase